MNNVAVYIEYEEGMTWREFVESSYNDVLKMYIENSSDGYKLLLGGWILRNESEECRPDGKIEQSTDYFLTPLY